MINVYVYVMDNMADWELPYLMSELHSRRFFKADAPEVNVLTVGNEKKAIKTMGGLTVIPELDINEMRIDKEALILLPGSNTWSDPSNNAIILKAKELLDKKGRVAAICGATTALANAGLLDNRHHTSNGKGFLEMFCPNYKGSQFYLDEPSAVDGGLFTAGTTAGLSLARDVIKDLGVFKEDTLKYWYDFFNSGKSKSFFLLMSSLPKQSGGKE